MTREEFERRWERGTTFAQEQMERDLDALLAAAVQAEREAVAALIQRFPADTYSQIDILERVAAAIRRRGETG
jgi:hypothetical protein